MKREFLEGLGLDKENIDKVMAEHGKSIEVIKTTLSTKETELADTKKLLEDANKEIEGFKDLDIDGIKQAAGDYKEKFEAAEAKAKEELENIQFEHELENAIRDSKAKSIKAVKALLDIEGLRGSKNRLEDIKKALEETKADNDYLFEVEDEGGEGSPYFIRPSGKNKPTEITKEQFDKMDYHEKRALYNKDVELYRELAK